MASYIVCLKGVAFAYARGDWVSAPIPLPSSKPASWRSWDPRDRGKTTLLDFVVGILYPPQAPSVLA